MELNAVKSNDAYKALLSEIDAAKKAMSVLEDEILQLMDDIDGAMVSSKKVDVEVKNKEQEIQTVIAKLEAETQKFKVEFDQKKAERDEFSKQLPQDLLSRYDHIRESRDGVAIAALSGDICGGCSCILRPQTINDIIKGKDLVTCDNCSRFIYKKNED